MKINNTAKLAFEMLEQEMEVLDFQTLEETKGGTTYKFVTNSMTGMIERYHNNGGNWYKDYDYQGTQDTYWTGPPSNNGSGSSTGICLKDPNGIYGRYETYLNNQISGASGSVTKAFFQKELDQLNLLKNGGIEFTIRDNIGSEKNGLTYNNGTGYTARIANLTPGMGDSEYFSLVAHEIQHQNQILKGEDSSSRASEVEAYSDAFHYQTRGLSDKDYLKAANDFINANSGEGKLYPASYDRSDGGSTGYSDAYLIVSTGFDDIGSFGVYQTIDSSGNSHTYIQHNYGYQTYYGTYGYAPADTWQNMIGLLSSGADDYGSYFNYSFNDEYGNYSTGYYHPNLHNESTGNSTGNETTGE